MSELRVGPLSSGAGGATGSDPSRGWIRAKSRDQEEEAFIKLTEKKTNFLTTF